MTGYGLIRRIYIHTVRSSRTRVIIQIPIHNNIIIIIIH